jgi:hypothetical protein
MSSSRRQFLKSTGSLLICFSLPGCSKDGGKSGIGYAYIDQRIRVESSGIVDLSLGKVELGQGIGTALAQSGVDTDHSPDESYTFSTISVQQSGPLVRRAAATGRQFLLQRASVELGEAEDSISVANGKFLVRGAATGLDYWKLLKGQEFRVELTDDETFLPVSQYRTVGKSVERLDIPGKLFGAESYLQDLRLPDMVHARVVRPPAERSQLLEINTESTGQLPGVLKVIRDGNFVAVVAEREHQARIAARELADSIRWSRPDDLPESDRIYEWLKTAPTRVEAVASRQSPEKGDSSTKSMSAVYQRPYQAHASISPSMAIALYDRNKLTIWSHAQGMYPLRSAIAHTVGLNLEQVRCIHREAAGCFGHNGADDAACDANAGGNACGFGRFRKHSELAARCVELSAYQSSEKPGECRIPHLCAAQGFATRHSAAGLNSAAGGWRRPQRGPIVCVREHGRHQAPGDGCAVAGFRIAWTGRLRKRFCDRVIYG